MVDSTTISTIKEDLNNLIKEVKKYNSNICLLGKYYINDETEIKMNEINNIYRGIAKDNNIAYINITDTSFYLSNNTNYYPISKGYEEISKSIIKIMNLKDK